MHLTFEEYRGLGGALDEESFAAAEPGAEMLLDGWTLDRLKSGRVVADLEQTGEYRKVKVAMARLVDRMQGIERARKAKSEGTEVTSFDNGVNSFSFGGGASGEATAAEASAYHEVCRMLPVELVSACVAYNDAR
nr:MAG: Protein of unknown function (DUF3199) [Bacteriophage sp.]